MKSLTKLLGGLLAAALPLGGVLTAAPLLSLGEDVDLFFKGGVEARYETNIFNDSTDEEEDFYMIFSPGVQIVIGQTDAKGRVTMSFREDFYVYADHTELDTENANLGATALFDTGKLKYDSNFVWYQTDRNNAFDEDPAPEVRQLEGELIEREITRWDNFVRYEITELFAVGVGFQYLRLHYVTDGFVSRSDYSVPVNVYYSVTPKIDVYTGYRYRDSNVKRERLTGNRGVDYQDHDIYVGVSGEIAPKLTGSVQLGYQFREPDSDFDTRLVDIDVNGDGVTDFQSLTEIPLEEQDGISAAARLTYVPTPKITLGMGLTRDFSTSSQGANNIHTTAINFSGKYNINRLFGISANAGFRNNNYDGAPEDREDDIFTTGIRVHYDPVDYVSLSAGYRFVTVSSDIEAAEYDNNIFNLAASLRY